MDQIKEPLFSAYSIGDLKLTNRIVMASLTKGRTTNENQAPTRLHATHYAQRVSAGLIITESS